MGIGMNYGPVVLGDVGTEKYVEFTIIGDTVNTASRLQQATRTLQCDLVVSQNLVTRAVEESSHDDVLPLLKQLIPYGDLDIRGRTQGIAVSTFSFPKN